MNLNDLSVMKKKGTSGDMMTKIVYNSCYGGFGISAQAIDRYWEIKGEPRPDPEHWWYGDVKRDDPVLAQVVEELGEGANASHAYLNIREIPKGTLYRIDTLEDGMESVDTYDDYEWSVA